MNTRSFKLAIIVCVSLVILQTVFMFIPLDAIRMYNLAVRPILYAVLAVALIVFMDSNKPRVQKAYESNMVAVFSVILFGMALLFVSLLVGAGRNVMTLNPAVVVQFIWERGSIVILGEFIRYKLIKAANHKNRDFIIISLTIVLAYAHMSPLRMAIAGTLDMRNTFFNTIFSTLMISTAASYFAFKGSLLSATIISFTYIMGPGLVPVLPNITALVLSLIISGLSFISMIMCYFFADDKSRDERAHARRVAKYEKKPLRSYAFTGIIIGIVVAFFIGLFPIYPMVVLTDSMEPAIARGSLVFIQRVSPGRAFAAVDQGDVLHFTARGGADYIHRVISFTTDTDGQRQYITQGDASERPDLFPVPQDNVRGVVRAFLPFFGYPYLFARAIRQTFT